MRHAVPLRLVALAACGCLLGLDASALNLGRARAAVLIGRPLDVAIFATLDPADGNSPCADAEIFHGDHRVERAPTVRWEPGSTGQGVLRVQSTVPVDEPMVTIYLRVGCGQGVTRRYVLLAEPPPEVEPVPAPPRLAPATPPRLVPAPRTQGTLPEGDAAASQAIRITPSESLARPAPRTRRAAPAEPTEATPAPAAQARRVVPPAGEGRPPAAPTPAPAEKRARARLKLEPFDLAAERDPTLRISPDMRTAPTEDAQLRQSAAALWDALRKPPEEAMRDNQRMQTLEREMQSLRQLTQQNAAAVVAMKDQVEKARDERNMVSMVGVALLAALLGVGGWLGWGYWSRRRHAGGSPWFEPSRMGAGLDDPDSRHAPPAPTAPPAPSSSAVPEPVPPSKGPLYTPASAPRQTYWGSVDSGSDFQQSHGGSIRMVGVEELIDIQDKADFFLSLGQHDQAIAILEAHVHDQVETSPLAWLDLLELYHKLGKRDAFNRLREEFRDRFAAAVPEFDQFDEPTGGLENYERALSRIVSLWPSHKVLEVIEESIFRKPGLPGSDTFSLDAYRELILLYHVAREVAEPDADEEPRAARRGTPSGFPGTDLQPLSAEDDLVLEPLSPELLLVPPPSARLGLDIDLDAPAPPAPPSIEARGSSDAPSGNLLEVDFDTGFFDDLTIDERPPAKRS